MIKDCVATLIIGSKDITLSVGERGVNGAFSFKAVEKVDYYSYFDGEFYDVKELEAHISSLFTAVIQKSEISKISTLFVGVPGEFSKVVSKNYKITFAKPKKITVNDVKYLLDNNKYIYNITPFLYIALTVCVITCRINYPTRI